MSRFRSVRSSRSEVAKSIAPEPRSSSLSTGSSQIDQSSAWMDGLMQFVQVDADGRPEPLDDEPERRASRPGARRGRPAGSARKLLHIR